MRSVNKVILVGNLTRDPEIRTTSSGQKIVTFGIATNREWTDRDSQKRSLAEYHNVVAWGRLAELCTELLKKGDLVYVEGYLKTRSWDHPETGAKQYRTEIIANDMILLRRKDGNGSDESSSAGYEGTPLSDEAISTPDDDFFSDFEDTSDVISDS